MASISIWLLLAVHKGAGAGAVVNLSSLWQRIADQTLRPVPGCWLFLVQGRRHETAGTQHRQMAELRAPIRQAGTILSHTPKQQRCDQT
jgi:hypothetical protein